MFFFDLHRKAADINEFHTENKIHILSGDKQRSIAMTNRLHRVSLKGLTLLPAADAPTSPLSSLPLPTSLSLPQTADDPGSQRRTGPGPDRTGTRDETETMTEANKTHVILLSCGSFNPITKGHIHMFGEHPCEEEVEEEGVGGWRLRALEPIKERSSITASLIRAVDSSGRCPARRC